MNDGQTIGADNVRLLVGGGAGLRLGMSVTHAKMDDNESSLSYKFSGVGGIGVHQGGIDMSDVCREDDVPPEIASCIAALTDQRGRGVVDDIRLGGGFGGFGNVVGAN